MSDELRKRIEKLQKMSVDDNPLKGDEKALPRFSNTPLLVPGRALTEKERDAAEQAWLR